MAKKAQLLAARICAGLGYISLLLQWFFVAALYFGIAKRHAWFDAFSSPNEAPPVAQPNMPTPTFGVFELIVVGVAIVAVVGAIVYVIRHAPKAIIHSGDALTHAPADALVPFILAHRHARPTARERRRLSEQMIWASKLVLCSVPLVLVIPVALGEQNELEPDVIWSVAIFSALTSLVWFVGEWLCMRQYRRTAKNGRS